jgi:hypothetical protein
MCRLNSMPKILRRLSQPFGKWFSLISSCGAPFTIQDANEHDHFFASQILLSSTATEENDKFPIILLTPPPFDAAAWSKFRNLEVYEGRTNQVARAYGERAQEVAKASQCSSIDVWELLEGGKSPEVYGRYLSDGLHLNELGNRKVHEGLMELLRRDQPHLAPLEEGSTSPGIPLEGRLWEELC